MGSLKHEFDSIMRNTFEALADAVKRDAFEGISLCESAINTDELRVQVGPVEVFFRAAFGLSDTAWMQFGHFVLQEDGRTVPIVDGEWTIDPASNLHQQLRDARFGGRILEGALHQVVSSIGVKHGQGVRLVRGVVQPPHVQQLHPDVTS